MQLQLCQKLTLETDVNIPSLDAILSQYQADNKLKLESSNTQSVSVAEANYTITALETLVVV